MSLQKDRLAVFGIAVLVSAGVLVASGCGNKGDADTAPSPAVSMKPIPPGQGPTKGGAPTAPGSATTN